MCELHNRYVHELDAIREARAASRQEHVQSRKDIAGLADMAMKSEKVRNKTPAGKVSTTIGKKRKIGRNAPCSCGSGKKYKKCCLN